jgi:2-amino-4-hydroxy-6-hydroxymethyldihydropteridine diphosphokinase
VSTHEALVALGGNLGDVLATFRWALRQLPGRGAVVVAVSSAFRTRAAVAANAAGDDAADYWNAAARLRTELGASQLLAIMQRLETEAGRRRERRWQARPLDLDLLTYGDQVLCEPALTLPHPRLAERPFVLWPLSEVASELTIPGFGVTAGVLLGRLAEPRAGILEQRPDWLGP